MLISCSQSEMEQLKSDHKNLEKQVAELKKQGEKFAPECEEKLAQFQEAEAKNSSDLEAKKAAAIEPCQKAFDAYNKTSELQDKMIKITLAMIAEDTKGKE